MNPALIMHKMTTFGLILLAAGIFTSPTLLSGYQIFFGIPVVYYSYRALAEKKFQLPASAWWLFAFMVAAFLSLIVNLSIVAELGKNFGRLKYYFFAVGGIFVMRSWLSEASLKTKRSLVNLFLVSIIVVALIAFWQVFSGPPGTRAHGLTQIMRYGYGSAMILLSILSGLLHREKIRDWFDARLGLAAFFLGFAGMYLTYTRGALLGFICGLPFVLFFYRRKLGLILGGVSLLTLSAVAVIYFTGIGNFNTRFLMRANNESDIIRQGLWKSALIAVQEKPILGQGLSNFGSQLKRIKTTHNIETLYMEDTHAHNLFLEIAAGTGLVGIILFLGWIVQWARESLRSSESLRAQVVPFGVAFVVASQFEVTFDISNVSQIFFMYTLSSAAGTYFTPHKFNPTSA